MTANAASSVSTILRAAAASGALSIVTSTLRDEALRSSPASPVFASSTTTIVVCGRSSSSEVVEL